MEWVDPAVLRRQKSSEQQSQLRRLLQQLGHQSRFRPSQSEKQLALTNEEMFRVYERCYQSHKIRPQVVESIGEPCSQSFTRFVAFWHGESLPPVGWQGLQSAVWAGYEVILATFETDLQAPLGVKIFDASSVLPRDRFEELLATQRLPQVADLLRLLTIRHCGGGWFQDVDVLQIRACMPNPPLYHAFASLRSKPGALRKTRADTHRWWLVEYLAKQGDQLHLASPFFVPAQSPWLTDAIAAIEAGFQSNRLKKNYNSVMKLLQQLAIKWGLACPECIAPPEAWCGIDHWKNPLKPEPAAERQAREILKAAFGVAAFWQSSRQEHRQADLARPPEGCVWHYLLLHVEEQGAKRMKELATWTCFDKRESNFPEELVSVIHQKVM